MRVRRAAVILLTSVSAASPGFAQEFPSKPIRIIVPFPPGGSTDLAARIVGDRLGTNVKQNVLIDNRAGANGGIGAELAARAPADGYTLLLGNLGVMAINPAIYEKLAYDPVKDFVPAAMNVVSALILIAHPSTGVTNVGELVARARAQPGRFTYSSGGNGSAAHLSAELLNHAAGIRTTHVPFKGAAPATAAVAGGEVAYAFSGQGASWPLVKAGKLRALALTGPKRSAEHPETPTVGEAVAGFEVLDWNGMFVPAGTPREVIARLNTQINAVLNTPDARTRMVAQGLEAAPATPEQFVAFIRAEREKWDRVAKAAKIRVE